MNGVSVLIKVMRGLASPLCSLPCEDTMRSQQCTGFSLDPDHAITLISDFQPPEL